MSKFSKNQPKDGETILHCGHLETKPHHFFAFGDGNIIVSVNFTRPDGSRGEATWMVLCNQCFAIHQTEPEKAMRADAIWIGDEPAIKEYFQ
jgi:hypothetical protein